MHWFSLPVLGLLAHRALAFPQLDSEFSGSWLAARSARGLPAPGKKGVFLMNRIGPSTSELYLSDADGSNERKLLDDSRYEYHASFSPNGEWITFTSERAADGQSDIYRVRSDGSGLEKLVATPSCEDAGALSPDGKNLAYVSSANGYLANIWVMDLETGEARNLTDTDAVRGVPWSPNGYFSPAWSPNGEWIAFASDRNTEWKGHDDGLGWEHTQELSIYIIRPDGTDFRQIATKPGYCLGSPKWSPDGERIIYYQTTRQHTWDAHRPESIATAVADIYSIDIETGSVSQHTSGVGMKLYPQYIGNGANDIAFLHKSVGPNQGLNYTNDLSAVPGEQRSPNWSPDGKKVVYEKVGWTARPMEKPIESWQQDWAYRFTDVFPALSLQGRLAITQKQLGNSSIVTMNPDGSDATEVFNVYSTGALNQTEVGQGLAGAFQPDWSRDGKWIVFGLGYWFQARATGRARIYRVTSDGSHYEALTDNSTNAGFPSFSHDGTKVVYRVWGASFGLRVVDVATKEVTVLTTERDNLPHYSPDGTKILFTRKMNETNFDVCTMDTDGSNVQVLTSSGANEAHAVWHQDGRIMYSSGMYGFRAEATSYDDTFQPYGQIMIMNPDGSDKRMLTDSLWEDSMPLYLPNEVLE